MRYKIGGKYTKAQCIEFIRMKVRSDDVWAYNAMKRIYSFQTEDEKVSSETRHDNGFGFTQADGMLSKLCYCGRTLDQLSEATKIIMRNKMKKYSEQLFRIVMEVLKTEDVLVGCMDRHFKGDDVQRE